MHQLGLKQWKEKTGYHERSLAETCVYRFKQLACDTLKNLIFNSLHAEVLINAKVINAMNRLDIPEY
ncbi:hypothetical protein [Pseudoalteromonas luteoviolacea]|nr:hypothetical protein [Pseudoalteromonas luteoviolacea]